MNKINMDEEVKERAAREIQIYESLKRVEKLPMGSKERKQALDNHNKLEDSFYQEVRAYSEKRFKRTLAPRSESQKAKDRQEYSNHVKKKMKRLLSGI